LTARPPGQSRWPTCRRHWTSRSGGAVTEARGEASRSGDLIRLAGFEGDALVTDPRVRKISFTGSTAIGQHITEVKTVILHGRPW